MHANNRKYTQTNNNQVQRVLAGKEHSKVTIVIPACLWLGSSDFMFLRYLISQFNIVCSRVHLHFSRSFAFNFIFFPGLYKLSLNAL